MNSLYITSAYYSITTLTTVGYGDISPINNYEKVVASIGMILGSAIFAYMINHFGIILADMFKK